MLFPYGISDFKELITQNYFYCDRTNLIPLIEKTGKSLLFLRPRCFGKSLLISMLENYYMISPKRIFLKNSSVISKLVKIQRHCTINTLF